jgi:hypothetical protein
MDTKFTVQYIHKYIRLWVELNDIHLIEDAEDGIIWDLTTNGEYSTTSMYNTQFLGATVTNLNKLVLKILGHPNVKFFAWLALQNRI